MILEDAVLGLSQTEALGIVLVRCKTRIIGATQNAKKLFEGSEFDIQR